MTTGRLLNRKNAISPHWVSNILTTLPTICAVFILIGAATSHAGPAKTACSAALSVPNFSVSHEEIQPERDFEAELLEDERKIFSARQTPANLAQRVKMQGIQLDQLTKMARKLDARDITVQEFSFAREGSDAVHGAQITLFAITTTGQKLRLGNVLYQAKHRHYATVSFAINVEEDYRDLGVSTALAARAIEDNPQTEIIHADLTGVNLNTYENGINAGLSNVEALNLTPAMKMRRVLGYSYDPHASSLPESVFGVTSIPVTTVRDDLVDNIPEEAY
ncbi:MAG TPA: hypothetical protein VM432_14455 [Bdellovibrionales bacterium]|nr:hypothetical protein [Bdellovibrionales bacterium]